MTEPVPQRIGDTDRDQAATCLREHLAQGRLSQEEFDERLSTALAAKTAAELQPLFADLPDPRPNTLQGVAPMESPWPAYNPPPPSVPAVPPTPTAPVPAVSSRTATAWMVATAVAWPAWLMLSFATSWRLWWLVWIPIMISALAGKFRSQTDR